jgi:hypothetical protein
MTEPQPGVPPTPPPPPAVPAYATPPAQGPYAVPPPTRTNTLAIVAFILSMTGILMILPVIGSIVGIILAYQARKQIPHSGEEGGGLATAAIWIGWIALIIVILSTLAFILFFVILAASTSYN